MGCDLSFPETSGEGAFVGDNLGTWCQRPWEEVGGLGAEPWCLKFLWHPKPPVFVYTGSSDC